MLDAIGDGNVAAAFGLLGGIMLGLAARLGRFCTLGAIEDYFYGASDIRVRMWMVAIGTAIIGTFALIGAGLLQPASTAYLASGWMPAASIFGGLMFGYGMALAGNCGFGALARLGGGDLRAFVIVLVMGMAAAATLGGPFAYARIWLFPPVPADGTLHGAAHDLATLTGLAPVSIGIVIGAMILIAAVAPARMRAARKSVGWGVVVGLAIVSGWAGTQWIADTGFDGLRVMSHTFSAPLAESIFYAMTASGSSLSFGVGSVAGIWIGAFTGSLIKGHFRWEACEDPRELRRQIIGAGLMGVGGVVAMGCSVGQGLSAFSVLAWSAPITLAAIVAGAALGLCQLIAGFAPAE